MAKTETEILLSLVPEAEIESITFENNKSGDNKGIFVRIVYSISDVVEQDAIGTWFDQIQYEKYFQVRTELRFDGKSEITYDSPALTKLGATDAGILIDEPLNNSRVSKFRFEKTYKLAEQPKDMSFAVVSSFNIFQMERDFGIDLFRAEQRDTEKRQLVVIYSNEQLQYPIQDFRIREELKKFELSEERMQSFQYLARDVEVKKTWNREVANDFFSDLWITRNAQGEAKFIFIFDAISFFEKKSEYRDIYKRLSGFEKIELIREMQIPSLKIMRKRVKVIQDKNGRSVIDFKDKYSLEEIVETRKVGDSDTFDKVVADNGSIMQVEIEGISQSILDDNNLVFITGTDYSIADVTDGTYAYGVSVEVIDTTRQILLRRLKTLNDRISLMREILALSILPKYYNSQTDLYEMPLEEIVADEIKTRDFKSAKDIVKRTYKVFLGDLSSENSRMINNFFRMDRIKSPKEVEMIIEVMETLLRNASNSIGESSDYYTGKKDASASDVRIIAEKYFTSPDKIFDSNIPKLEGMEYLSNFEDREPDEVMKEITSLSRDAGDIGVRVIDGGSYERRIQGEISKYFAAGTKEITLPMLDNETAGTNTVSLLGTGSEFLTISAVLNTVKQPAIFLGQNDTSASTVINKNDVFRNVERHLPGAPIYPSIDERQGASYLSKYGASFGDSSKARTLIDDDAGKTSSDSRTRSLPDTVIDVLEKETRKQAPEKFMAQKEFEDFVYDKVVKQVKSSMKRLNIVSAANLQGGKEGSVFSKFSPIKRREIIERAPNQVVSYSVLSEDLVKEDAFTVSSEFLTKVSYLSGFEKDEGKDNVSLPKWESLTLDTYRNNANKNLLCRIKPYHFEELGIRAANSRTPIYDAFFIISPVG